MSIILNFVFKLSWCVTIKINFSTVTIRRVFTIFVIWKSKVFIRQFKKMCYSIFTVRFRLINKVALVRFTVESKKFSLLTRYLTIFSIYNRFIEATHDKYFSNRTLFSPKYVSLFMMIGLSVSCRSDSNVVILNVHVFFNRTKLACACQVYTKQCNFVICCMQFDMSA